MGIKKGTLRMKKYKKSSLKYKNRAWVIVFTNILQLLNFMMQLMVMILKGQFETKGAEWRFE